MVDFDTGIRNMSFEYFIASWISSYLLSGGSWQSKLSGPKLTVADLTAVSPFSRTYLGT
jgi:hypothetical protein